jgi:hypothetical protein
VSTQAGLFNKSITNGGEFANDCYDSAMYRKAESAVCRFPNVLIVCGSDWLARPQRLATENHGRYITIHDIELAIKRTDLRAREVLQLAFEFVALPVDSFEHGCRLRIYVVDLRAQTSDVRAHCPDGTLCFRRPNFIQNCIATE